MDNLVKIYVIKCPHTGNVKYVGQTKNELSKRLSGHLHTPSNDLMKLWLESLNDVLPIIEGVQEVEADYANSCEQFWISFFKSCGFSILNISMSMSHFEAKKQYQLQLKAGTPLKQLPIATKPEKKYYKFEVRLPEHLYLELSKFRNGSFPKWSVAGYLPVFLEYAIPIATIEAARNNAECLLEVINDETLSQEDKIKWINILK